MSIRTVLKIAKTDKDLRDNKVKDMSLYSPMFLPKIYAVKKVSPVRTTEYEPATLSYTHGRGYPPMFITYREQQYLLDNSNMSEFNPVRYTFEAGGETVKQKMSSTAFVNEDCGWYSRDHFIILFLNPLEEPSTAPSPTSYDSPRLKIGENLRNTPDYKASIDSKYQTLKVHSQGQFVCNLPSWNSTEGSFDRSDWFNFSHGLNYPPVFAPFGIDSSGLSLNLCYRGDLSTIPTDFTVNDIVNKMWEERNWLDEYEHPTDYYETLWLFVDSTKMYLGYRRLNLAFEDQTFPARTVRVNYTIFNLPINKEFNLLS